MTLEVDIAKMRIKRGLEANLPVLDAGEPALAEDTGKLFIGTPTGNVEIGERGEIVTLRLTNDIKGTTQSITWNSDGTVSRVDHVDSASVTLRTDVFTYGTNTITEVRTLNTSESLTFIYHLDTYITEVI